MALLTGRPTGVLDLGPSGSTRPEEVPPVKIHADHTVCEGIGMCEATADDYFEVGDDGFVKVLDDSPDESERTYVKAAVDACPVSALRLEG